MNRTFYMFLLLTFISCGDNKQTVVNSTIKTDTVKTTAVKEKEKIQITDYMSDEKYIHWKTKHPDTTQFMCELSFAKEYAIYWYHGQCQYFYFTTVTEHHSVDLLWAYKTDCILNMDFLEKSNGVKNFPKRGDTFAKYTLVNDTTLQVKYYFPEWVRRINEMEKDSIFPTYFYLEKKNGSS